MSANESLHFDLKEPSSALEELTIDVEHHDETRLVGCLICPEQFSDGKKFCQHLVMEHNLIVADSKLIAHLKGYSDYWRKRFQMVPYTDVCSPIVLNCQDGENGSKEQLYLLSSALPEDRLLRERLRRKRLEAVLEQHDRERRDKHFERTCLFCKKNFHGNRGELFKHMADDHNLSFGHPDNLVFVHMLLDLVEEKLEKHLQCLFCEKTFNDRTTLKEHMRKKLHKKINPKNTEFDKFYLINYLETDKNWECVQAEDDSEIQEMGDDMEEMWGDYHDKEMGSVCLFCDHNAPDAGEILKHMKDVHFFDLPELKRVHKFTYYEQVKLVNYIRRQMFKKTCIGCLRGFPDSQQLGQHLSNTKHMSFLPDETMWNQPLNFFPTFENDNLLCALEDNSDDDDDDELFNDVGSLPTGSEDGGVAAEHIDIPLDSILWNESIRQQLG